MSANEEKAEGVAAENTNPTVSTPSASDDEKVDSATPAGSSDVASEEEQSESGKEVPAPRKLQPISRSQRRGLFGYCTLVPEVEDAYTYPNSIKWMMTLIVAVAGATSSTGSSIFYPALDEMARDLNTTPTITNLSLAFYMLAMAFSPLWWSSFSETLGRRSIYIISFSLFVIFSILSAVSVNIEMLIIFRIFSGAAAASVQAVGAGTAADIWETKERGKAMGLFYIGPLCGPGIAPIIGGALTQGLGWRSTLWFLTIFGALLLILLFFCLPETLSREKFNPKAKPDEKDGPVEKNSKFSASRIGHGIFDPLKVLKLLRHPPILVSVYSAALSFGALFVINVSIQSNFINAPYNFSTIAVGLLYLAPTLGYAISSLLGGRWVDYIMAREARKAGRYDTDGKLQYLPEDRMKENVWLASSLYPAAMIWYGWSVDKYLPWIVSCIANFFFGLGMMLVFGAVTTMLTEFTPKRSSSGVAINNFMRNIFSCIAAVVTQPLINAMGTGWMCTMVGLLAWVTSNAAIFALRKWGPQWRVTMDKKLNAQKETSEK